MRRAPETLPEAAREELAAAMLKVAEDYRSFVAQGPAPGTHDDAKAFAAHHAAAKSALAHLEHLLKLARAQGPVEEEQGMAQADALLREARGALRRAAEQEGEDSDSDADGDSG